MLQLSSMIRTPESHDRFDAHFHTGQPHLSQGRVRQQDAQSQLNSGLVSNPYSVPNQRRINYGYQNQTTASTPPSPPGEEANKPSLPSISSLLGISEAKQPDQVQQLQHEQQQSGLIVGPEYTSDALAHNFGPAMAGGRMSLPPTPPLVPDSNVEGNQSPSTVSTQSTVSAPQTYFLGQPVAGLENHHRQTFSDPSVPKRLAVNTQTTISPFQAPHYSTATYVSSPGPISAGPYYSAEPHVLPSSGLYGQRSLPSNFPPPVSVPLTAPAGANASNPWQHHHFISASSQASFPQSQDRYVCPTCSKAFSRPSSLRIHSHSHTGEKPFKCSHAGCGKAFSVRSNMKRHERGCHAGNNSVVPASS